MLLLVPTYTWQAYANLGRDPAQYPGLSHYAVHRDGSPVYITTRLKPAAGHRAATRVEVDGVDSFISGDEATATADASHLLMADLYANWWLERTGVEFGAITDEDLHHGGAAVLAGCRALVLSAHPEYWTEKMLQSLSDFLGRGGSAMYLGGNGLYWVTSVHPSRPHLLEVRRRAGSQTSAAPAGEDAHVFEAQPGGTWPGRGRPPDHLVGVGFAGFGWDRAVGYRRTEASYGEHFGWVFAGVEAPVVGTEGLNMGGAVAFEFDRYDPGLAPPAPRSWPPPNRPAAGFPRLRGRPRPGTRRTGALRYDHPRDGPGRYRLLPRLGHGQRLPARAGRADDGPGPGLHQRAAPRLRLAGRRLRERSCRRTLPVTTATSLS